MNSSPGRGMSKESEAETRIDCETRNRNQVSLKRRWMPRLTNVEPHVLKVGTETQQSPGANATPACQRFGSPVSAIGYVRHLRGIRESIQNSSD